jgi:hypothetical protein
VKKLRKSVEKQRIRVEKSKFDALLGKLIDTKPAPKESIKTSKKRPSKVISGKS